MCGEQAEARQGWKVGGALQARGGHSLMRVLTVDVVRNQQIQSYLKSRASGIS